MRRFGLALTLAAAFAIAACATRPGECPAGRQAVVSDLLYFGTARPHGIVSEAQWGEFLATVVTPRFPQGLTAWPANGQWREAGGPLVRERSYVLNVIHDDDARSETSIADIVQAYRTRFEQQSVLRTTTRVCATF
jgi:hypothetical protein